MEISAQRLIPPDEFKGKKGGSTDISTYVLTGNECVCTATDMRAFILHLFIIDSKCGALRTGAVCVVQYSLLIWGPGLV